MAFTVPDELLGGIVPFVAYWFYSGLFVVFAPYLERYRIHAKGEEEAHNIATKSEVVKGVLLEQAMQFFFSLLMFLIRGSEDRRPEPSFPVSALQFLTAMFVLDTWMYFTHRALHSIGFLYRRVHAQHHRQVVTYPYGAQYNHVVEGFVMDTVGPGLGFLVSGMTPRAAVVFYTLATVKGVDDHCGLWIPWNPLQRVFVNNSAWHDVHHQLYGLKHNFSTPFFPFWDRLLGTHMPFRIEKRSNGGYRVRPVKSGETD